MFQKNRKRCAEIVLNERWNEDEEHLNLEQQKAFWRPLFSTELVADCRPTSKPQILWHLADPVTPSKVDKAIKESEESAPGTDGITLLDKSAFPSSLWATYYNLWMVLEPTLNGFSSGETVLANKGGLALDPANYRPITMTSRVTRIFHKILSAHHTGAALLNPKQKAFVPVDGCTDNVFLLDSIIRCAQQRRCPLCLAFLGVVKAFDCVSHHTLEQS